MAARALAAGALAAARERWTTGGCVAVRASLPEEVEEGSSTAFVPEATSLLDGEQVDGRVNVDVEGPGQVREDGDGFVFTAGREPGRTTTLRLRFVSARGVAVTTLEVDTPSPDLRVDAPYKTVRVRGVKCDGPEGRWKLELTSSGGSSVGDLSFRLDQRLQGRFSGSRRFASPAGTITVSEGGTASYLGDSRSCCCRTGRARRWRCRSSWGRSADGTPGRCRDPAARARVAHGPRRALAARPYDGAAQYRGGHVPGAAYVDLERDLADPPGTRGRHPLPDPQRFATAMRRAGVSRDRPVVVYDDWGSRSAARCWWLLRHHGHRDVRVLDGGWRPGATPGGGVEAGTPGTAVGDFRPCGPASRWWTPTE